jgi:hypothetical protein
MDPFRRPSLSEVAALAARQHGVVTHGELRELGLSADAIRHRVARGRLHRVHRGVYALGRAELSREGRWMAAVRACGENAVLSFDAAGALYGVLPGDRRPEVSLRGRSGRHPHGIRIHRPTHLGEDDVTTHRGIPVTTIARTLVDLGSRHSRAVVERAVDRADAADLIDPEALRDTLDAGPAVRGTARLRAWLDEHTFVLTESQLERHALPLFAAAGLGIPHTRVSFDEPGLRGTRADFHWPDLGLVIETDGRRYHRTAAQQTRDARRDQLHTAAGRTPLRYTHWQVRHRPAEVLETLAPTVRRLRAGSIRRP